MSSPRRSFLARAAASLAALATGTALPRSAHADTGEEPLTAEDAWLERISGKHRQVFDCISANGGFGAVYALNYMDSHRAMTKSEDRDLTTILVYRHGAMPLVLNDAMWDKYAVGALIDVKDSKTGEPARRNVFRDAVIMRPGLTYERMMSERGVIVVACNMALTALSARAARNAGVTPEQAKAEWTANLIPGAALVHSGVYAVNRAQEKGCTYCFGG